MHSSCLVSACNGMYCNKIEILVLLLNHSGKNTIGVELGWRVGRSVEKREVAHLNF